MASASHEEPEIIPSNEGLGGPSNSTELRLNTELPKDGVFLTWEDLWVSVSKNGSSRIILHGLTGYAQPGEVLAIMGPSGSGKSTLLDALAGRLDSSTRQSGEILVNGLRQRLAFGTSAYVTQDDALMTTLTVREVVYYSALLQLPDSMSKSEKRKRADTSIKEMGLQEVMNTRIGGQSTRGISGGQKRRVSICLEILTNPKLLFLDEPTSGLDSAASYHVTKRIVGLAKEYGRTVVTSIHQPSTEVFELFHNLCLLSSGKTLYFGPASAANEFFSLNGFPCPTMMNPSDHYLKTINTDFDKDIEQGLGKKTTAEEAISTLVASYKSYTIRYKVDEHVVELLKMDGRILEKGSQAGFITQSLVLTRRSFLNMNRDIGYYWLRLAIYIGLCSCLGSIFYNIGHSFNSIQARGSMLMFVASLLTFMAIGGFPSFAVEMKIFGRERLNGHYGVASFVFANTISSVPYLFILSAVPGAIAYFSLLVFRRGIVPDFLMGIIAGAGVQGLMILNSGFFRLPNDLPNPLWKYPMYYIAFQKYANQALYKNEYEGLIFPNQAGGGPTITSGDILKGIWQMEVGYSKWVDLCILIGMVVLYRLIFFVIIKTTEKMKPIFRSLLSSPTNQTNTIMVEPSTQ